MRIVPQKNNILTKKTIDSKENTNSNGFFYEKENIPVYEVIDIGHDTEHDFFNIGDHIIVNSTGTLVKDNDIEYYLFNVENIVAKVEER